MWLSFSRLQSVRQRVSIHTPTKGVTAKSELRKLDADVSIHTPTKGVTSYGRCCWLSYSSFNPHTHEGCDNLLKTIKPPTLGFNPHTHEGCDSNLIIECVMTYSFNPHTHEGCDNVWSPWTPYSTVSIHTPTKGVTYLVFNFNVNLYVSIHTPTKGVTSSPGITSSQKIGFNPHTHEGCDSTCQMW